MACILSSPLAWRCTYIAWIEMSRQGTSAVVCLHPEVVGPCCHLGSPVNKWWRRYQLRTEQWWFLFFFVCVCVFQTFIVVQPCSFDDRLERTSSYVAVVALTNADHRISWSFRLQWGHSNHCITRRNIQGSSHCEKLATNQHTLDLSHICHSLLLSWAVQAIFLCVHMYLQIHICIF